MKNRTFWIILGIIVVVAIYVLSAYNGLVTKSENVTNQWAQVETQYQRRFDLIPNLVESVKGIFEQEQTVFDNLADARTKYAGAGSIGEKAAAATEVEGALARLLVVVENYPELRSSEAVQTLMAQLEGTENRVSVERKRYNDAVRTLNVSVKRFPTNVIAGIFGFTEEVYFEAAEGAETVPAVEF